MKSFFNDRLGGVYGIDWGAEKDHGVYVMLVNGKVEKVLLKEAGDIETALKATREAIKKACCVPPELLSDHKPTTENNT